MRILVILLATVALAAPALARGGGRHQKTEQKADDSKLKANDKGYKAALDRLPAQKYDAWRTVRPDAKP